MYTLTYHLALWEHRKAKRMRSGPYFTQPRASKGTRETLRSQQIFPCRDGEVALELRGGTRA